MTREELLSQLYDDTLVGNKPAVLDLTNQGLAQGIGPEELLYEALIPSLEEVGARFERGDFFVPEMLIAGKAMAGALEILRSDAQGQALPGQVQDGRPVADQRVVVELPEQLLAGHCASPLASGAPPASPSRFICAFFPSSLLSPGGTAPLRLALYFSARLQRAFELAHAAPAFRFCLAARCR